MPIDPEILSAAYDTRGLSGFGSQVDPEILAMSEEEERAAAEFRKTIQGQTEAQKQQMLEFAQRELEGAPSAYLRTATRKIGATVAGLGARVLGYEETADKLHRLAGAYTQAHSEKVERELPWGVSHVMKAGTEITAQAPVVAGTLMTGAGAAGLIAQASITTADAAYTEAKDAGKSKKEAVFHATAVGLVEGGITAAFQAVGLGGVEKVLGKGGAKAATAGAKGAMRRLGITMATELPEEVSINFAQSFVSWYDRVDPDAMSLERLKSSTADVILQTILTAGAYSTPSLAAGGITTGQQGKIAAKVVAKRAKIIEIASEGRAPTRSEWTELGFSKWTARDAGQRQAMVEDMAAVVQEQDAAAEPVIDAEVVPQEEGPAAQVDPELLAIAQEAPKVAGIEPDAAKAVPDTDPDAGAAPEIAQEAEAIQKSLEEADALEGEPEAPGETTGVKKVKAAEIRAAVGLSGLEGESPQGQAELFSEASAKRQENPHWIPGLIESVTANPRTLEKVEVAGIGVELRSLVNDLEAQRAARDSDDPVVVAGAETTSAAIISSIDALTGAMKSAGTEWARSGHAMQIELKEDFSFGMCETRATLTKGEALSREERGKIKELTDKNKSLMAELSRAEAESQVLLDAAEIEKAVKRVARAPSKRKAAASKRVAGSTKQFKTAIGNLVAHGNPSVKAFLKGESGAMAVPIEVAQAGVEVVKAYVDLGVVTFSEFWGKASTEFRDLENARDMFEASWGMVEADGSIHREEIAESDTAGIARYANKMLRAVVQGGETNSDAAVTQVHKEIGLVREGISRRQTIDAMTGQGRFAKAEGKEKVKSDLSVVKRQIKLQRELEAIEAQEKFVRQPWLKDTNPKVLKLKKAIAEAKSESPILKEQAEVKREDTKIKRLEAKLADVLAGKGPTGRKVSKDSGEAVRIRREIVEAKKASVAYQKAEKARGENTYIRQLERSLAKQREILAAGDYALKPKAVPKKLSEEATELKFQIQEVRNEIEQDRHAYELANRSRGKKAADATLATIALGRTVVTCVDLALLRQGMFATLGHPVVTVKAAAKISGTGIFKLLSEGKAKEGLTAERAFAHQEELRQNEYYSIATRNGLAITDTAGPVTSQEEVYAGHILKQFEGQESILGWAQEPLARSERAYTMLLNQIRIDRFSAIAAVRGPLTDAQAKVLANFINITTGHGNLGAFEKAAVGTAQTFFAPRFVSSRFRLAVTESSKAAYGVARGDMASRAIAVEYGRTLAGLAMFWGIAATYLEVFGDEDDPVFIGLNPWSTDFGKIKIGNRRLDTLGGVGQVVVFLTRLATQRKTTSRGENRSLFRPGYAGTDVFDLAADFTRGKMAPLPSTAINVMTGEDIIGRDVGLLGAAEDLYIPFTISDTKDAMEETGVPTNVACVILAHLGMSLQTYDADSKQVGVTPNPWAEPSKEDPSAWAKVKEAHKAARDWNPFEAMSEWHPLGKQKGVAPNPFWGQDEADWEE